MKLYADFWCVNQKSRTLSVMEDWIQGRQLCICKETVGIVLWTFDKSTDKSKITY